MNHQFKDTVKTIIMHFFVITVCVMFVISAANALFTGFNYTITPDFPWVMMLTGLLGALPSLLFCFRNEPTKKQFILHVILHYFAIEAVIMTEGGILGWYTNFEEGLVVFGMILIVYALAWLFSFLTDKNDANKINAALKEFNNDSFSS